VLGSQLHWGALIREYQIQIDASELYAAQG
jgi:hypothetical protein